MTYARIGTTRYKVAMETGSTSSMGTPEEVTTRYAHALDTLSAQTPLAVIGLAAIGMIFLINSHAQPTPSREKLVIYSCAECGTVVSVRRAADAAPWYVVEIQMLDGSLRTIPQAAAPGFNVGDIVRVNGNALMLRPAAS